MSGAAAGLTLAALAAVAGGSGGVRIDHVILGVSSLEAGVAELKASTGVEAAFGGQHPGAGTQNALASLGEGVYLEILAPVPGAEVGQPFGRIMDLGKLAPVGWAVAVEDAEEKDRQLRAQGFATTGAFRGARERPDGSRLEWSIVAILDPGSRQLPFFIDWSEASPHPSTTSPPGCRLVSVAAFDPDPARLREDLERIGAVVEVREAPSPGLRLTLACPKGEVEFAPPSG